MAPFKSNSERRPSPLPIPDLTNRITRPEDQYCEAGGFGDVFRCRYTSDDGIKEVAVKSFRFSFSVDDSDHKRDRAKATRMIRRELGIWSRLHHRNIVPFLGITYGFGKQGSASLVSLWMSHDTLHSFLEAHEDELAVSHRLQLLLDIANGLHYLHSFPMVHGDLSSNNVLLDHNYNACLTDFGCASLIGELPEGFTYLKTTTVRPGTLRWAAPEHFSLNEEETKHTIRSDIYSFGNMALLVLSGKYPWSEVRADAAVVLRLSQGLKPGRPVTQPIDDKHWALIERCWSSVLERPLTGDIVSSLEQLLGACPLLPPLRELLSIPAPPPSVPNYTSNDNLHPLLYENALEHVEAIHSYGIPSGMNTIVNTHYVEDAGPSSASDSSHFLIHPFLNGDTPRTDFHFDLAFPTLSPLRSVGPGQLTAISGDELQEPATFPPITRMRISHDAIPQWPIDLEFRGNRNTVPTEPPITLGDVLLAIHSSLHRQITHQDWAKLSLREETEIARAYTRRYKRVPSSAPVEASEGVKRVDYLLKKHVFRGLLKAQDEDGFYRWSLITT